MSSFTRRGPYEPRQIRCLGLWQPPGWRLKVYGIAHRARGLPEADLVAAVEAALLPRLAAIPPDRHHGAGWLIVHQARAADFVLLDWWADENTLFQLLWRAPTEAPADLTEIGATGQVACVWELAVQAFERDAWTETVLANPDGPDLDAYLARRLDAVA